VAEILDNQQDKRSTKRDAKETEAEGRRKRTARQHYWVINAYTSEPSSQRRMQSHGLLDLGKRERAIRRDRECRSVMTLATLTTTGQAR
jgi:hypothetical protein